MPWPQTAATHYHAQIGLPDKGRANKRLVVCFVVLLESLKGKGLAQDAWVLFIVVVRMLLSSSSATPPIEK